MNTILKIAFLLLWAVILATPAPAQTVLQFSSGSNAALPSCASSVLDSFAASPGAWTAAHSLRKLKAAYGGSAIQLHNSNTSATQAIGFTGCDPDTTVAATFCQTATLAAGTTSSARVAYPAGTVIHVYNQGPSGVFYASGNGSVAATTASTILPPRQGANITVGANTNLAAIIGTGFGLNGTTGSANLLLTNCGVSIVYDQSGNTNDLASVSGTLAGEMGYAPASFTGGKPILFGCLGCGLKATDSSTYKTTTIETFAVMTFGEDTSSVNFNYAGVIYPSTTSSAASVSRWGFTNNGNADLVANNMNASNNGNGEGLGGIFRGQNLTQWDYSSGGITRFNGGTQFLNTGGGTPTYPNAVGLYVMGDAAGNGSPGIFVESLVASGTQTSRNSISANQVSYWSITTGAATSAAISNPLADGWNWNRIQIGSFAPIGVNYTVNGNSFASEGSWNDYSQWQASNGDATGGKLGDKWRFQVTSILDQWDGTFRSELDGSGSAQFSNGTEFWLSYAVYIEAGTPYTSQWNINGQMHTTNLTTATICCIFNTMSNSNSVADQWTVFTYNQTSGAQTSATSSFAITRGRWYHFVYQVKAATAATGGDTFNVWLDTVTAGTMVQIASHSSATLFGGNAVSLADYWKYGIYRETGNVLPTFAIDYGNMQICSTGADCTTKYGVSDLSARETTPLADPAHL